MKTERGVRKWIAGLLCAAAVLGLTFFLWSRSPGPQWMAHRTAQRYLERYAPEYSYLEEGEPAPGAHVRYFAPVGEDGSRPIFSVSWPTWVAAGQKSADDWDTVVRLELWEGWFPWKVTDACYFSPETGMQEELPID